MFEPYIDTQRVWGKDLQFHIATPRSEGWYSYAWWLKHSNGDEALARRRMDEWNPNLMGMIHEGDVVLDVGCNEGWTTVLFAQRVGPTGLVIAIDGSDYCVAQCQRNVAINRLTNVKVLHRVVSDKSGESLTFKTADERVMTSNDGVPVPTIALDDLAGFNPTVMKIDIEGYELPAFRGARKLLDRGIRMEVDLHLNEDPSAVHMTRLFGFDPADILQILDEHGYSISRGDRPFDRTGPIVGGCVWCTKDGSR